MTRTRGDGTRPFAVALAWVAALALAGCDGGGGDDPCRGVDCDGHGVCALQGDRAVCLCDDGYLAGGTNCTPDPCRPDPCAYGTCQAIGGQGTCRCDEGYAGTLCDACAEGYLPRGHRCVPGDPCEGDPCVFGLCSQVLGEIVCTCHAGYAGERCDRCDDGYHAEGLRCVDRSPCDPNPCVHGDCRSEGGEAACACAEGYAGDTCDRCADGWLADGVKCVPATGDPCDPNPCAGLFPADPHRTVCLADGAAALCLCEDGWTFDGTTCRDEAVDPCDPNPCPAGQHRSVCAPRGAAWDCLCDAGWVLGAGDACVEDTGTIEARDCTVRVRSTVNTAGPVYVRGEFNGWGVGTPMTKVNGAWEAALTGLVPGDYAYKLYWKDGSTERWELDADNPYTRFVAGVRNSRLRVPDCNLPLLALESGPTTTADGVQMRVAAYYGQGRTGLDPARARVTRNGQEVAGAFDPKTGVFTIADTGLAKGKHSYRFEIADIEGRAARPLFVPTWVEAAAFRWQDAAMYFVLLDRFSNGTTGNDQPTVDTQLDAKANWQGGDFEGLRQRIESGYFDEMGINVLWISSPVMNTQGAFWGSDGHKYTGYHSYWPIATGWTGANPLAGVQPTEPHFGSLDELKAVVKAAHARGIRVIADFVANHVHTDSPLYGQHKNDSAPWFNWDGGQAGKAYVCGWDRPIECWFAEYLPDFDYRNNTVMDLVMDHAVWLVQETDVDGFRLDAVKHMILDFSATLRARLDEEVDTHPGVRFYMVGETFTGEGDGEKQTIRAYVSPKLLDGQFDFPMFWAALASIVRQERGLDSLKGFMDGNDGYYGSSAVMSTFLGNHDVPRVLSHAAGQIGDLWGNGSKEQGWSTPPQAPSSEDPYRRLRMAWTFLFTQVGVPLIYYGDEIGLPGAGDPDNRRMMKFAGLSGFEQGTLDHVRALGKVRSRHAALRSGGRQTLDVSGDYWAYAMKSGDDRVLVVLNRGAAGTKTLNVGAAGLSDGTWKDALSGKQVQVTGGQVSLAMDRLASAVFEM